MRDGRFRPQNARTVLLGGTAACLFFTVVGCASGTSARARSPTDASASANATASGGGQQEASAHPVPPKPGRAPSFDPGREAHRNDGPTFCAATRPDLHRAVIAVLLEKPLRPETMSLLGGWLRAAWRGALPETMETTIETECAGALLCATFARQQLEQGARALQAALDAQSTTSFFQVRSELLDDAAERDRLDAQWRLQTTAWAMLTPGPYLERLLTGDSLPPGVDLPKVLTREAGASWMSQVSVAVLQAELESALSEMRVVILGAPRPDALLHELSLSTNEPSSSVAQKSSTTDGTSEASRVSRVHIEENAGDLTQAILLPLPRSAVRAQALEAALRVVVTRVKHRFSSVCRIEVDPVGGVFSTPAIRVDGPYDGVQAALLQLEKEARHLASDLGGPSESEWQEAVVRANASPRHAFSCGAPAAPPDAEEMHAARKLLGTRLAVAIWGNQAPLSTDESSE